MGRPKGKKSVGEGDDGDTAGGEVVTKLSYTRALQKWKVEACYQLAARNYQSAPDSASQRSLPGINLRSTPYSTLLSWLIERNLQNYQNDNASVALRSIVLSDKTDSHQIEPWRCRTNSQLPDNVNLIDLSINVGGPIWCASFAPTADPARSISDKELYENAPLDRYIVVGTSQVGHYIASNTASDGNHLFGQSETNDNLLQIWRINGTYTHPKRAKFPTKPIPEYLLKKLKNGTPSSQPRPKGRPRKYPKFGTGGERKEEEKVEEEATAMEVQAAESTIPAAEPEAEVEAEVEVPQRANVTAELVYCVALQARGPTWSCAWSPQLASTSTNSTSSTDDNVLGVAAIVNGDGSCLILQLPKRVASPPAAGAPRAASSSAWPGEEMYRANVPVVAEAAVRMYEISVPNLLVCSATWSNENPLLCTCGMSDGSIMLWDLNKLPAATDETSPSGPLSVPHRHLMDLQLLESQVPSMAAVRAVEFCPYDSNIIATCGPEDVKVWSLKDSSGPLHAKRSSSSLAAVAWDPTGYGYYYAEAETTSLTWNPLWGINMKHIFRKELYTHHEVCGGMWAIDAFVHEGISFVLSAASDGTIRGGYTSLMTSFKAKNTTTMQIGRAVSAYPSADGRICAVHVENTPRLLPVAIGTETFPQSGEVSVHALHSVHLGRPPFLSLEIAPVPSVKKTPKKAKTVETAAATPVVLDSDSEEGDLLEEIAAEAARGSAQQQQPGPSAAKKRAATKKSKANDGDSSSEGEDEGEGEGSDAAEDLPDSDSECDSDAATPAKATGTGKEATKGKLFSIFSPAKSGPPKTPNTAPKAAPKSAPKSVTKSTTKSAAKSAPKSAAKSAAKSAVKATPTPQIATFEFNYTEEATQPAGLRLVAYGGQSGLLRIHTFDPLGILVAPALLQTAGKKK